VIFVDTGAFLARYLARDQHHAFARKAWQQLPSRPWRVLTSNFVLDETFTLLARWATPDFAGVVHGLRLVRPHAAPRHRARLRLRSPFRARRLPAMARGFSDDMSPSVPDR